jgi:hypothetical protein
MERRMFSQLAPIRLCEEMTSLRPHEILVGVAPSARHERLLEKYLDGRSRAAARTRIVADIREALKAGTPRRAVDLAIVLRQLLAIDQGSASEAFQALPAARRRGPSPRRRPLSAFAVAPAVETQALESPGADIIVLRRRQTSE